MVFDITTSRAESGGVRTTTATCYGSPIIGHVSVTVAEWDEERALDQLSHILGQAQATVVSYRESIRLGGDPDAQCRIHGCARWRCDDKH